MTASLPFRAGSIPFASLLQRWDIIVTLLAGSLIGAWLGAGWATRLHSRTLFRVLAVLLVAIAAVLLFGHEPASAGKLPLDGPALAVIGAIAGFGIGVVASLMGVAGGELLIPAIVLLFGVDIKFAGSLSLAVSLPTMIVGFTRYSRDQSFSVIRAERSFLLVLALGSVAGAFLGGQLLGIIPTKVLLPVLAAILVISSVRVWGHR